MLALRGLVCAEFNTDFKPPSFCSQVRRLDSQVERISLVPLAADSTTSTTDDPNRDDAAEKLSVALTSPGFNKLLPFVRALSSASNSGNLLSAKEIKRCLVRSGLTSHDAGVKLATKSSYEAELEWLLVSKATVQTYGLILNTFLSQIIPLSDDIWYWDEVLGSYSYSSLYTIQTSPLRLWALTKDVYYESRLRLKRLQRRAPHTAARAQQDLEGADFEGNLGDSEPGTYRQNSGLSQQWRWFYSIVKESIVKRSFTDMQRKILSPVALCRAQARKKQVQLRKLRELTAAGLGILLDEGLSFGGEEANSNGNQEWKGLVERSVALMDMVLRNVLIIDTGLSEFEDKVFNGVEEDPELSIHAEEGNITGRPRVIATRLVELLDNALPGHVQAMRGIAAENGRPSRLIRYWLPALLLLASSSTILRVLTNHHSDIINWVGDLGATMRDFWFNWVIDPIRKIIGTIRHDANSEIAIMSRDSLKADRESLQRMVVDFALDKPQIAVGTSLLTDAQVANIRLRVNEGDVTPVLKAYEKDLKRPLIGAVRGDLVRSLLIQVQKTKVDLEVAIDGINALLKSQELVFGLLGLTPGVLGQSLSFLHTDSTHYRHGED